MALVWIGNKVEKISKNSQILHWNFKFLVKIEIYVTGVGTLGTMFSKPYYYFGIGPFLNPINYFDYKKVKLYFSEEILIFWSLST